MRRLLLLALACTPSRPHPRAAVKACTDSSRGCLYQTIARETSNLDGFALASYGAAGRAAIDKLRARKGYDALVVDPAIVLHVDDFLRDASGDPWAARGKWLATGGTVRVYHAVVDNGTVVADIKKHGLLAPHVRGAGDVRPLHLVDEAAQHLVNNMFGGDGLISVSKSAAVARCTTHTWAGDDRPVIVYTLEVPARELIHFEAGMPVCGDAPASGTLDCSSVAPPYSPTLRPYLCAQQLSPDIEAYVVDQVDPAEITGSETVADFADCNDVNKALVEDQRTHNAVATAMCRTD